MQLRDIYPELLKRLDDSQDHIREKTCEALEEFFNMLPEKWSESLFVYMIKSIIIHLDDPKESIQTATKKLLIVSARVNSDKVLEIVRDYYLFNDNQINQAS